MPTSISSDGPGRGRLIVSLDCEGKWGMADHITAHHDRHLNEAAIADAYRRIVRLFEAYEVSATFAFVMGFTLSAGERSTLADRFVDVAVDGRNWLHHYRAAEARGILDGWFCPDALEMVRDAARHEIACHGFCHLPLAESAVARDDAIFELESSRIAAGLKGLDPRTFVYPRNQIGHVAELAAAGFDGYRARPPERGEGAMRRVNSLLSEFDLRTRSQHGGGENAQMIAVPSGYFLNWQRGIRRIVPRAVSRRRWTNILGHAAETGGVAHVWLHPHNIIDGPGTIDRLEDIVAQAARLRDADRLDIMTMRDHCDDIRHGPRR